MREVDALDGLIGRMAGTYSFSFLSFAAMTSMPQTSLRVSSTCSIGRKDRPFGSAANYFVHQFALILILCIYIGSPSTDGQKIVQAPHPGDLE